jgi:hypothetical protein
LPADPNTEESKMKTRAQAPGYYRCKVGDIVVTALNDGALAEPADVLTGIDAAGAAAILTGAFRPPAPLITVNAFLIETPDRTVLLDTGCGNRMGPTAGRMAANLAAAGIAAADVDLVLLTHLHPDHVNGLLTADGGAERGGGGRRTRCGKAGVRHGAGGDRAVCGSVRDVRGRRGRAGDHGGSAAGSQPGP